MIRRASLRAMGDAGDTLVEVAMALAILAATLLTAFNIASSSYAEGMQAREHTQAIQLAQDQAEKLRYWRDYLIQQNVAATVGNPSAATQQIFNPVSLGACYAAACNVTVDATGTPHLNGGATQLTPFEGVTYTVAIRPQGSLALVGTSRMQFNIEVQWAAPINSETVNGQNNQNVTRIPLILVDKRGITPRDCSLAGTGAQCN